MPPRARLARLATQVAPASADGKQKLYTPPANTGAADHVEPIFRNTAVDVEMWERDGFMAFPSILTPSACRKALQSVQVLQAKNDAIIMDTDWNALPWHRFGLPGLATPVTHEQKASLCGGCELPMQPPGSLWPPGWSGPSQQRAYRGARRGAGNRFAEQPGLPLVGRGFETHGFLPASFPLVKRALSLSFSLSLLFLVHLFQLRPPAARRMTTSRSTSPVTHKCLTCTRN